MILLYVVSLSDIYNYTYNSVAISIDNTLRCTVLAMLDCFQISLSVITEVLIDLPREDYVYAGEETCFCVGTTSACTDADVSWDGSLYRAKSNRTGEKNLTTYWYCGIISKDQNGSTVQFHLTSDVVKITNSTPVLLKVAGKWD